MCSGSRPTGTKPKPGLSGSASTCLAWAVSTKATSPRADCATSATRNGVGGLGPSSGAVARPMSLPAEAAGEVKSQLENGRMS
jgi:hypothetical protein